MSDKNEPPKSKIIQCPVCMKNILPSFAYCPSCGHACKVHNFETIEDIEKVITDPVPPSAIIILEIQKVFRALADLKPSELHQIEDKIYRRHLQFIVDGVYTQADLIEVTKKIQGFSRISYAKQY